MLIASTKMMSLVTGGLHRWRVAGTQNPVQASWEQTGFPCRRLHIQPIQGLLGILKRGVLSRGQRACVVVGTGWSPTPEKF